MKYYNLLLMACLLLSCKESDSGQDNDGKQENTYSGAGYVTGLENSGANVLFTVKFPKQGTIRWKSDIEIQEQQTQRL